MNESPTGFPCRIAADIGGTFTDIAHLAADGTLSVVKLLSTRGNYADAVVKGISELAEEQRIPLDAIDEVLHGCTIATNAILERKGARTALITTRGFRDVLELRRIRVPKLYDPLWCRPVPLVPRHLRFEVDERVDASGRVLTPLDDATVRAAAGAIRDAEVEVEAVAVCLINSFVNPDHEQRIGEILAEELPGRFVSLSVNILPQIREYERTSTTVINAYVGPPVKRYISSMAEQLAGIGVDGRLMIMQSSGGVLDAAAVLEKPAQIIECGPAAGVIGARHVGRQCGYENIITFDMGGTTAKASLIEGGRLNSSEEYEVGADVSTTNALVNGGGYALRLPVIDISEVGAGGGSIIHLDKVGSIKVGPRSAGALPGPACYGRGGTEPTVTDANVVLGYLSPTALAGGSVPIDAAAAETAISTGVAAAVERDVVETAYGIHLLANANMMRALKAVTTNRGRDPRNFVMFAFGGSGGVHAVSLARELRIRRVVVPPAGGVFSALGLLFADLEVSESRSFVTLLKQLPRDRAETIFDDLAETIVARIGLPADVVSLRRFADLRYAGQAFELTVRFPDGPLDDGAMADLAARFNREHQTRYGHCFEGHYAIEVVTFRLVGTVVPARADSVTGTTTASAAESQRPAYFGPEFGFMTTPIIGRGGFGSEPRRGPLVIEEYEGTVVVPPDAGATLDPHGNIVVDLDPPAAADRPR